MIEAIDFAMRNCDPAPKAGRAQALALGQAFDNQRRIDVMNALRQCPQLLKERFFIWCHQRGNNRAGAEKILQIVHFYSGSRRVCASQ